MLLLSKDLETAEKWAKVNDVKEGCYAFVDNPEILKNMEDIPLVIFPEIKNRKDIKEVFIEAKRSKVRPALSSIFYPSEIKSPEPIFNGLDTNKYNDMQVGLGIQKEAVRWLDAIARKCKIKNRNVMIGKSFSTVKPIFIEISLGWIYVGNHDPSHDFMPEEMINY